MAQRFSSSVRANSKKDINILLLGETGVGKSTFINAFANYLAFDTLEAALQGDMLALVPSKFIVADPETYDSKSITVRGADENELCEDNGESQTQGCKSYTFPIGNRCLRLIDTPGVGDCRGISQDNMNFDHIFNFIARYGHLDGLCLLFKPNQERITIPFRYCIQETLKYLPVAVKDNILFIFTNAQATFFSPGSSSNLLQRLLAEIANNSNVAIPFAKPNTFFFDNEPFRYLAVRQAGFRFLDERQETFVGCWEKSVAELKRMMKKIVQCGAYSIEQFKSVNDAYQLIRRLPRPIAEVVKFIQENLQLAKEHENKIREDANEENLERMPENTAEVVPLRQPCLVCTNPKCAKLAEGDGDRTVNNQVKCLEPCQINEAESEMLKLSAIRRCRIMDRRSDKCRHCNCDWSTHRHIAYNVKKRLTYVPIEARTRKHSSDRSLRFVQGRIERLKQEQEIIRYICTRLTLFLQLNSISPTNEDVLEYIQYAIREEKQHSSPSEKSREIIQGLEQMIEEYQREIQLLKADVGKSSTAARDLPTVHEIFACRIQMCELPISGRYMRDQLQSLESHDEQTVDQREEQIVLPSSAANSTVMQEFKRALP